MRLNKLELKNYCQHADLSVEFVGNLNGIVGANGIGKSNLLGAVYFALTNDNPNTGKKQENIRSGTDDSEQSYVRLYFEHNGAEGVVTRYLRTGIKSKLTLAGRGFIEGDTAVTTAIMEMLGVDQATLRQLVIVSQDALYGLLSETPAVRAKLYQRLFQVDRAEKIHALLRDEVLKHQIDDDVDTVDYTELLAAAKKNKEETHCKSLNYGNVAEESILRDQQLEKLGCLRKDRENLKSVLSARQLLLTEQERLTDLQLRHSTAKVALADVEESVTKVQIEYIELGHVKQNYLKSKEHRERREKLQFSLEIKKAELQSLSVPGVEMNWPPLNQVFSPSNFNAFKTQLATLQYELANLKALQAELVKTAAGACPLCKTPADQLQGRLQELETDIAQKAAYEQVLNVAVQEYTAHLSFVETAAQRILTLSKEVENLNQSLDLLGDVAAVDFSEDSYLAKEAEYSKLRNAAALAKSAFMALDSELNNLQTSVAAKQALSSTLPPDVTDEYYAQQIVYCEGILRSCDAYLQKANEANIAKMQAASDYDRIKQEADSAAAVMQARLRRRAVHEHFKQLASIYHHDAAPKDLTQHNLELCQTRLNTILAEFGAKFSVTVTEDLSFDCIFPDKVQPAHRLSCGQRVVLALCLRIALVTSLLPEVGLLLLDEPTTFLDADTVKSFNNALEKLREFAAAANIQVVIVTHCTDLIPAFDGVIQL